MTATAILAINPGSSSLKAVLRNPDVSLTAAIERLSTDQARWTATGDGQDPESRPFDGDLPAAIARIAELLARNGVQPDAVAHRVVHGGPSYDRATAITDTVRETLDTLVPWAPLHLPGELASIDAARKTWPDAIHVACFDTAFHHSLPDEARRLPLPAQADQLGLRRYGFHGLSYEFMSIALEEAYGERARGRCIVAHLGSGASLCAMLDSKSVGTTMGFSALDGLMMGTRCGALDPGAVIYLMEIRKLSLDQVARMLYHESGLLGVSGISSDPRVLLQHEDDAHVREALALYVRSAVREVGALTAALNGLDMLAFTAGIGEHNAVIRERICAGLGFLGVELDPSANAAHAAVISSTSSKVRVVVVPTNEEWVAATAAAAIIRH
jgi:acetate kinase